MRPARTLATVLAGAVIVLAAPAAAQSYADIKGMDERFRLDLGGFFQQFDTTLRLDSTALGVGTEINLEDDLGQDAHKTSFRAGGYWRFGRHGRVDFGVLTFTRSATRTLSKDIQFGDHVYHAGATTDSRITSTQAELYYAYSFVNTGEFELGAKLGFSAIFQSVKLEATGSITGPGGTVSGNRAGDDRSVVAPIPAIGAYARFTLLPGLFISGGVKGLPTITVSGYSGNMVDAGAFLDWYPWKNFGLGAGYSYWKILFERQSDPTIRFDYSFSGPLAYLTVAF